MTVPKLNKVTNEIRREGYGQTESIEVVYQSLPNQQVSNANLLRNANLITSKFRRNILTMNIDHAY